MTTISIDQVRNKAVQIAQEYGWIVAPAACRVVGIADDVSLRTGQYTHWRVDMPLEPAANAHRPLSKTYTITADVRARPSGDLRVDLVEPPAVRKTRLIADDAE